MDIQHGIKFRLFMTKFMSCKYLGHYRHTAEFKVAKKFREKFLSPKENGRSLISPSAENREKCVHLGRLFLPSCPVADTLKRPKLGGCMLHSKVLHKDFA